MELRCHLHLHGLLKGDVAAFGTGRWGEMGVGPDRGNQLASMPVAHRFKGWPPGQIDHESIVRG